MSTASRPVRDAHQSAPRTGITESQSPSTEETAHIFSVDVEEYFHAHALSRVAPAERWDFLPSRVEHAVDALLEQLDRHRATGTFFTLGWVAERHPTLVRRIAECGHEVASHGWWHLRVAPLGPEKFRAEVRRSKALLEDISGQRVLGHRAPSFSILPGSEWAFDVLLEEGYAYDSSLFPIRRAGYGYPSAPADPFVIARERGDLLELPMTVLRYGSMQLPSAGGAYFRLLPFALTRAAIRAQARRNMSAMFYVHPWEVDAQQPRLPVSRATRVRHYGGLARMSSRIERLLTEFRFTSIARRYRGHFDGSSNLALSKVTL